MYGPDMEADSKNSFRQEPVWQGRLALAIALLCLSGTGLAWVQTAAMAQTSSAAAMSGPMRISESPLGLMVGDYVGRSLVFLDPGTMAVQETVPLVIEQPDPPPGEDPGPVVGTKPLGVASMNGLYYVGDERTGAIQVYEKGGSSKQNTKNQKNDKKVVDWIQVTASLTSFPVPGPSDIVADEALGLLFVASRGDRTVYVLDAAGTLIRTIGGPASTLPLGRPQGLALDRTGQRIYVSDDGPRSCGSFGSCYSEVRVYSYFGAYLGVISGRTRDQNTAFSRAQGLTVDSFGDVYVVDSYRGQVLVFREVSANAWSWIGTFGAKGIGFKELLLPMDVVVDEATATVYVTNSMQRRIEVFAMEDMVP